MGDLAKRWRCSAAFRLGGLTATAAVFAWLALAPPGARSAPAPGPLFEGLAARQAALCTQQPERVTEAWCAMRPVQVQLEGPGGRTVLLEALAADTSQGRAAGYQFIHPDVVAGSAILFVFERDSVGPFHMCNVQAALDIVWFRSDGRVLDRAEMHPGPALPAGLCRALYQPRSFGSYRYALETPAGALEEAGIDPASVYQWRLALVNGPALLAEGSSQEAMDDE